MPKELQDRDITGEGVYNPHFQDPRGPGYRGAGGVGNSYPQPLHHEATYPGYRGSGVALNPQEPGYGVSPLGQLESGLPTTLASVSLAAYTSTPPCPAAVSQPPPPPSRPVGAGSA